MFEEEPSSVDGPDHNDGIKIAFSEDGMVEGPENVPGTTAEQI